MSTRSSSICGGELVDLRGEVGVGREVELAQLVELGLELDERALELHDEARLAHDATTRLVARGCR